jgi:two-component system sensor histidine kinase/response regulator
VLAVDDSPGILALLKQYLSSAGFDVITATDGLSALRAVDQATPDLVVLDVMIPGLDGYGVTERIKGRSGAAYLPVVLVTAGTLDRERGLEVGADDFLGKPIDRVELLARVRSLLRLRDAIEEARRRAEELKALDRSKQRFVASVAHDLRTPLNAMGLTVQMLRLTKPTPAEVDEALGVLSLNVAQMNELLSGLLDYSQIVAGVQPLSLKPFDPRTLVAEVRDTLAATAAQKRLELALDVADDLPHEVTSDYSKCRQVVVNLVSNALKFTTRGRVTIGARRDPAGGWAVDVADTGVGIAAEDLATIFEEFGQARVGRPRGVPGTGLGLAICRRLVERLGGRISVISEPGRGSTFSAVLPDRFTAETPA